MKQFIKNKPYVLTIVGLLMMAQSILWEYVRVRPDFRFLIEPWSQRGYEVSQGFVIASGAVLIAVIATLTVAGIIKETKLHGAIAAGVLVLYGVVASIAVDAKDIKMPFFINVLLAAVMGIVLRSVLEGYIPEEWKKRRRATRFGMWLVGFLIALFAVINPLLTGTRPVWVFLAVVGVVLSLLSLYRPPAALSTRRMIINAIVAIWVMSMSMSAALRHGLEHEQFLLNGVSADAQDLQITAGVMLAWLGGLLAFSGAVGLWAKRRDEIGALERARKQQEAARESEQQLSVTG